MGIFTGPDWQKELTASQKEGAGTIKDLNKSLDAFDKKIETAKSSLDAMAENGEEASEAFAETTNTLKELKEGKAGKEEELTDFEIEAFNKMNASLFKISDAEMKRRQDHEEDMKAAEEQLAIMKKDPALSTESEAASKNIDKMRDKEKKRRDKQQTNILQKGFSGLADQIKDSYKDTKGKAITGLKAMAWMAAYFAFAKFLQSPMFAKFTTFIQDYVIPFFTGIFDYLMKFLPGVQKAFGGLVDIFVGIFEVVKGIITLDMDLIFSGFGNIFSGLGDFIMGIGGNILMLFDDVMRSIFGWIAELVQGIANIFKNIFMAIFNIFDGLTGGMYTAIFETISTFFSDLIGGFTKIFEGDILGGLTDIFLSPFKFIGNLASNILKGIVDMALNIVNLLPFVDIKNPFGEEGAKTPEIGKSVTISSEKGFIKETDVDAAGKETVVRDDIIDIVKKEETGKGLTIVNQNVSNIDASSTATNQNSTQYVKDQGSLYVSSNA